MDYLDPKNLREHRIRLFIGYGLVTIAIGLLVVILLFLANGYNYKQGEVVRNGLVFFSSQPAGANLYVDGSAYGGTSQRLQLQAGQHQVVMSRKGYYDWKNTISVTGGEIERFDYPMLFPKQLDTSVKDSFVLMPTLASESPDSHKLLLQFSGELRYFQLYNLNLVGQAKSVSISLPANILTPYNGKQSLDVIQWAKDGEHVLLKHSYGNSYEYVLLDTSSPNLSLNLNAALGLSPSELVLNNNYYDQYFVYDEASQTLSSASLGTQKLKPLIDNVANFTTGAGDILYIRSGVKVKNPEVMLYDNAKNYPIQAIQPGETSDDYLLSLSRSNGDWYAVVTSRKEGKIRVYKNPLSTATSQPNNMPTVTRIMSLANPSYQAFSPEYNYILIENGQKFAVYDTLLGEAHTYDMTAKLDAPQQHANWMREGQLDYVSNGKLLAFDFDGSNQHSLMPASPSYQPFFDINYNYAYTLTDNTDKTIKAKVLLNQTPLLTTQDLQQ